MFGSESSGIELEWNTIIISFLGIFLLSDLAFKDRGFNSWINDKSSAKRWAVYAFLIFSITGFAGTTNHPFIYFQF